MGDVAAGLAAKLAADVYGVRNNTELKIFLMSPEFSSKGNASTSLTAEVGSRLLNTRDSFAVCARGGDEFPDDIFVLFPGTTGANYGADIITDMRMGLNVSATGSFVHSGFNQVFSSLLGDLAKYLSVQNGVKTIHCIGHSLGGAAASLAADWIKENYSSEVKLYTFGAPRIGFGAGFGQSITNKLLAKNIYRVYHGTDPVPMVPLFPFAHAPTFGRSYYLPFGGLVVNFSAHRMRNYITSIGGNDWAGVYQANPAQHSIDSIKSWLQSDSTESTQNSSVWEKINYALSYVLQLSLVKTQAVLVGGLTIADHLAMLLNKGLQLGGDAAKWIFLLIKRMMRMLGMKVAESIKELSDAIVRLVLNRISQRIAHEVKKAIEGML